MERQNIFKKNETSGGYWRWLVDPTWHHCASMYHEAYLTGYSDNTYERYHHLRSCLYFGIGMIEAFLNKEQLQILEKEDLSEKAITKKMMCSFYKKTLWPFENGMPEHLYSTWDSLMSLNDIRAEITHPKRKDHAIYRELDSACSYTIIQTTTEFMVGVLEKYGKPFPYWLLGWNFVGINNDNTEPTLINNSQFLHALQSMGYSVEAWDYNKAKEWENCNMTKLGGFRQLRNSLDLYEDDIQPVIQFIPGTNPPRLTRRWWDREFLLKTV